MRNVFNCLLNSRYCLYEPNDATALPINPPPNTLKTGVPVVSFEITTEASKAASSNVIRIKYFAADVPTVLVAQSFGGAKQNGTLNGGPTPALSDKWYFARGAVSVTTRYTHALPFQYSALNRVALTLALVTRTVTPAAPTGLESPIYQYSPVANEDISNELPAPGFTTVTVPAATCLATTTELVVSAHPVKTPTPMYPGRCSNVPRGAQTLRASRT